MYINNLFRHWTYRLFAPGALLREKYELFRELLATDKESHELIAELQQIYYDQLKVDFAAVESKYERLSECVSNVVKCLSKLCPTRYLDLADYFKKIDFYARFELKPADHSFSPPFVLAFHRIGSTDAPLVGNKALHLALAKNRLEAPVPEGFVVTTSAFNYFIEANNLRGDINRHLAAIDIGSVDSLRETSRLLQNLIRESPVPEVVESEILNALAVLQANAPAGQRYSVRSSAVGEDGRRSYAGLYETVLAAEPPGVVEAYKQVLASKYSARALSYRIRRGDLDQETPMAVLILPMIDAKVSGILYTDDFSDPGGGLVIHCVRGLGKSLVEGKAAPCIVKVGRKPPHAIRRVVHGNRGLEIVVDPRGTLKEIPVDADSPADCCLDDTIIRDLARLALDLEELFTAPQDIEWCLDQENRIFILQSRPLVGEAQGGLAEACEEPEAHPPALLSGGVRASGGSAAGVVHNLATDPDIDSLPTGAILVAKAPLPDYAVAVGKIGALVTDLGSAAGHLVTIAREFGIPALVNTGSASELLPTGLTVTVNADRRAVYPGRLAGAGRPECADKPAIPETPFNARLGKALRFLSPLNLVDPAAENFAPAGCKTLHDILRFSHEKAVMEMFSLGRHGSRRARGAKRLKTSLPMVAYLLDLGGGVGEKQAREPEVRPEEVLCAPFRALWRGFTHPGIRWNPDIVHFDWQEFDRISSGVMIHRSKRLGSYAVLSGDYLNFHIHFGYHFVVLDTLCTGDPGSNYVMLRFAGGGGNPHSRFLRVEFLGRILSRLGLKVERKGDLIDAHIHRLDGDELDGILDTIGRLLGCTRLLDMVLQDPSQVDEMVARFLKGDYGLSPADQG